MQPSTFEPLDSNTLDFIHDLAYDHFGKRVATCSSDQTIKIWQKSDIGAWIKISSFRAHDSTIFKVKWAHPDFGSIIASCSYDRSVIIWEEKRKGPRKKSEVSSITSEEDSYSSTFVQKVKFADSKESIEDIKFGPKHMGLVLASASSDGYLRIYEAQDLTNLALWKLTHEIQVNSLGINGISWNKNSAEPPMIAVAAKDANTSSMNKSMIKVQNPEQSSQIALDSVPPLNEDKLLLIYALTNNTWNLIGDLKNDDKLHRNAINDVSWALLNGRSFHTLASCGKDGVFIWYLRFEMDETKHLGLRVLDTQVLYDNVTVWKVSWNVMATLLAYSGQDGKVRICKCGYDRKWVVATEFAEEEFEEEDPKRGAGETRKLFLKYNE